METLQILFFLAWFLVVAIVVWQLFVIVGDMAERRNQDRLLWQIAALFINPLIAMLLLWLFCDVPDDHSEL